MKIILLSIFVVAALAAPFDDDSGPVDLIINGVPDGQPLEIDDLVNIKVQEHMNGELASASNILQPYTAQGLAEAAAAAAEESNPNNVLPRSARSIEAPVPVVESPVVAEIIPEPVAQLSNGEIFNDGSVQVFLNTPQEIGVIATLQSWFNMVFNYFSNGVTTTQQIV